MMFSDWLHGRDFRVVDLPDGSCAVLITANHRVLKVGVDTGARLRSGLACLTEEEAADWDDLVRSGVISSVHAERVGRTSHEDGANLAININLTSLCNLNCSYCFAEGGDYGRIKGKLTSATVPQIIDFARRHVTASRTVRLEFFGGEPLLNFARIHDICEAADAESKASGIRFQHRISTNLTLLPQGALELFGRCCFVVSVSIDGGRETHDRNRPGKGGQGSFEGILENCRRVRAANDGIVLVARMTVVGGTPALLDNVRELWAHNLFDYFQIYPAVTAQAKPGMVKLGRAPAATATAAKVPSSFLGQFAALMDAYPDLFQPSNRFRGVLEYERLADMLIQGKLALSFCSGGRTYFTISPDQSWMPCHRLVGDTRFQVGDAEHGLTQEPASWRLAVDDSPICSQCWARYACGGGCKQENLLATGDLNTPNPELCIYQTRLLETIVRLVASGGRQYRDRSREAFDDLFVSCGRPTLGNGRDPGVAPRDMRTIQSI